MDAAVLKAEAVAADIAKIPETAMTKAVNAFYAKKQEITDNIDRRIKSLRSVVQSVLPARNK